MSTYFGHFGRFRHELHGEVKSRGQALILTQTTHSDMLNEFINLQSKPFIVIF